MSGKVLGMRLVGYIRGGSTKEVPLGGVLKEKGIPDMKKKKILERRRKPGEKWAGKYRTFGETLKQPRYLEFGELGEVSLGGKL